MPFTETWTEELVAEWLIIQNYVVDVLLPIAVAKDIGGRFEADVVGVKVLNGRLNIFHIEVGQLIRSPDENINALKKKFSSDVQSTLIKYYASIFGFDEKTVEYSKLYIASYCSNPTIEKAKKDVGLEITMLDVFIKKKVIPALEQWKCNPESFNPKTKTDALLPPQSCWLLQLIDYLRKKGLMSV